MDKAIVEITATNGVISPTKAGTAPTDGTYTVNLKPDSNAVKAEGDFDESLQITVTVNEGDANEEKTVVSRQVKVRRLAS